MTPRRYETIVGIFVLASLAALLIMIFIIAQQEGLWGRKVEYHTVFKNVAGLKRGDEVRLSGVAVGNVDDIYVDREGNIIVTFNIAEKFSDRVREDSKAAIGYKSLLGEKSLDITAGIPPYPAIPHNGLVASVEPLDFGELLAKAGPSIESLQTLLNNLAAASKSLADPNSDFHKTMRAVKDIIMKIDQGQGTMGLLINDPSLYRETSKAMGSADKLLGGLEQGKGVLGTLMTDQKLKTQTRETLTSIHETFTGLSKATGHINEAAAQLPEMTKKGGTFFDNLKKAAEGLPGLVASGQELFSDADLAAKAAQRSWLLRRYMPHPKEHTIQVDRETAAD